MDAENSLVQSSFGALSAEHGSPIGIEFAQGELPFEEWRDRVTSLAKVRSFSPFAVGDVFRYGVEKYGEKRALSDTAIRLADHTESYIRKCADVCQKVPYGYRRLGMSFEHHAAVAKVKGNGCEAHTGAPVSDSECDACRDARYAEIANWLETADKKHWTAKELKDQIGAARTTTVREHQRNLDGKEFDVEVYKEAVNDLKTNLSVVKESLAFGGLLTKTDAIDRGKNKALLAKFDDLEESMGNLRKIIEANLA